MSEQKNVRTIQEIYDAFGRGDVQAILDQYVLVLLPVLGCDGDDDFINGRMHKLANGLLEYRHTTDLHQ